MKTQKEIEEFQVARKAKYDALTEEQKLAVFNVAKNLTLDEVDARDKAYEQGEFLPFPSNLSFYP